MNLEYLTTFVELINLGSFSEVARKLDISQPAVSLQIQKLELDLGVQLIDRRQKYLTVTDAGRALERFAILMIKEQQALVHALENLKEGISGDLVIAASTIPGEYILPALLGRFSRLCPAASIRVSIADSAKVLESVRNGDFDIGFCGMGGSEKELDSIVMASDEIVLIVYPEHPFAGRSSVSFAELCTESLIQRGESSGTRSSVESMLAQEGFDAKAIKYSLVLGSTESLVNAVEAKAGIAFVSNLAVKNSVALGLIRSVKVEGLSLKRDFRCVFRKDMIPSRLMERFIAFMGGMDR